MKQTYNETNRYERPEARAVPVALETEALAGVSPTGESFDDQEEYDGF